MIELILKIISNFQHKIEHVSSNLEYYFNGDFKLNFEIINNSFYPLFIHNAYLFNIENKNVFFQFLLKKFEKYLKKNLQYFHSFYP